MKTHFKELETAIFHINDKGTAEDKKELWKILNHKVDLQRSIIKCLEYFT